MFKISCPICRGTGKSDKGMNDDSSSRTCTFCNGIGTVKVEAASKKLLPLENHQLILMETELKDMRRAILTIADPYTLVPYSVEQVHLIILDKIDKLLAYLREI